MDFLEEALNIMVFSKNTPWEFTEIKLSTPALAVLCEMDGEKNLSEIARILEKPLDDLRGAVNELGHLNLIAHDTPVSSKQYEILPPDSSSLTMPFSSLFRKSQVKQKDDKKLYRGISY